MASTDPVTPEPRRFSIRLPWHLWFGLPAAILIVGIGLRFGLPICQKWVAIRAIERAGGRVNSSNAGPQWLRSWIGQTGMMAFEDVLEINLAFSTRRTDEALSHVARFPTLQTLDLGGSSVTDAGFRAVPALPRLKVINLSGTSVTDSGLGDLTRFENLETVMMAEGITGAGMSKLKELTKLSSLIAPGVTITDAALTDIGELTQLRSLYLGDSQVTDVGLERLQRLANLESLCLEHTHVTDAGLNHLARLTNLRLLDLGGTGITDGGLERLKGLKKLETLWLGGTQVGDAGLKHLAELGSLRQLDVQNTYATGRAISELKAALPTLTVVETPPRGSGIVPRGDQDNAADGATERLHVTPATPVPRLIQELAELSDDDELARMQPEFVIPPRLRFDQGQPAQKASDSPAAAAVREVVRRGTASLPELLRHVDDRKPTKVSIPRLDRYLGSNWYPPRFTFDPTRHPADISATEMGGTPSGAVYALTVGDVCYFVIGQIVNRDLRVVHWRKIVVITSPTMMPALAAAVRADWRGVTPGDHLRSLSLDARRSDTPASAVERLLFYYPEEGEPEVLKLLQRPLYQDSPAIDLVHYGLLPTDDPHEWKRDIDQFRKKFGEAMETDLQLVLDGIVLEQPRAHESAEEAQRRTRARKILTSFYPKFDRDGAGPPTSATYRDQASVVSGLCGRRASEALDAAVYRVFSEGNAAVSRGDVATREFDLLAIACISRLAGGKYDASLREFVEKRIAEIDQLPSSRIDRRMLPEYRTWLDRLTSDPSGE